MVRLNVSGAEMGRVRGVVLVPESTLSKLHLSPNQYQDFHDQMIGPV